MSRGTAGISALRILLRSISVSSAAYTVPVGVATFLNAGGFVVENPQSGSRLRTLSAASTSSTLSRVRREWLINLTDSCAAVSVRPSVRACSTHLNELPQTVLDVPCERGGHLVWQVRDPDRLCHILHGSAGSARSSTHLDAVFLPHSARQCFRHFSARAQGPTREGKAKRVLPASTAGTWGRARMNYNNFFPSNFDSSTGPRARSCISTAVQATGEPFLQYSPLTTDSISSSGLRRSSRFRAECNVLQQFLQDPHVGAVRREGRWDVTGFASAL